MTDTPPMGNRTYSRQMAIRQTGGKNNPVARRLRLLRDSLFGENNTRFANRVGISVARLSNFENGYPLSIDAANRIRAAVPGITLDWLYHGDERALPLDMVTKLRSGTDGADK